MHDDSKKTDARVSIAETVSDPALVNELKPIRDELARFMMLYQFGIDEISTKLNVLRQEFTQLHEYNPIEHVITRLKSPESIIEKTQRRGISADFDTIRREVHDIAGVRVVCSFVTDVYRVFDLLTSQQDVTLLQVKDYIREPKPNGYQSLHAIVQIPVFVSTGPEPVTVEIQFRTIAMDFWASLEHKIYYKYNRAVPAELLRELKDAADTATSLDQRMERLRDEIRSIRTHDADRPPEASEHALKLLQRAVREIRA